MSDTQEPEPAQVTIDAVPEPLARYTVADGDTVIVATNDAFERAFEDVTPGTTVEEWCRTAGLTTPDATAGEIAAAVGSGDHLDLARVWIDGGERPARLRAVPSAEGAGDGALVLTGVDLEDGPVDADRIASVVSHDLRNPLDIALAHLEAARDETDDPTVREHVDAVLAAHDRMGDIIEDVLTLARGEGAVDPQPDVAVGRVARDAWDTVDTEAGTAEVDDDLPVVAADPDRLRRLLENLFRNAVEHGTDPGSGDPAVHVRVRRLCDGPGFVVADDGPGFDPAERERAFVPGHSSTDRGTGLGLTIVQRIATAHGWSVALGRSEAGGARVELRFDGEGSVD